jgi:hypothetical protein
MRWAGHVSQNIFVGKPEGRDYSENLVVDGMIILQRILEKWGRNVWTGFNWLCQAVVNMGMKHSCSIKGGEFLY